MIGSGGIWAFLGLKEVVLVAMVALALYGRSGLHRHPYVRLLRPWVDTSRRPSAPGRPRSQSQEPEESSSKSKWEDRVFWFVAILAATAVAAWIVTRMLIMNSPGPSH